MAHWYRSWYNGTDHTVVIQQETAWTDCLSSLILSRLSHRDRLLWIHRDLDPFSKLRETFIIFVNILPDLLSFVISSNYEMRQPITSGLFDGTEQAGAV